MRKKLALFVFTGFMAIAFSLPVFAAEKGRPKTIKGQLVEVKNREGQLTGLKLKTEDGHEYQIILNPATRKMARENQGRAVELRAVENRLGSNKNPLLVLDVKSYKFQDKKSAPVVQTTEEEMGEEDGSAPEEVAPEEEEEEEKEIPSEEAKEVDREP